MTQLNTNVDVKALGKVAVLMGGYLGTSARSRSCRAPACCRLCARAASTPMPSTPLNTDLVELKRDGYARCFIALHGRARRRRHGAGRARAAGHPLHRLRA